MTTLFNLFCPMLMSFNMKLSTITMVIVTVAMLVPLSSVTKYMGSQTSMSSLAKGLFPLSGITINYMFSGFVLLASLNLISLVCYSYPVTTTLSFNFSLALSLWLSSVLIMTSKVFMAGAILPANSPWYLASFLSLVELVSVGVRPITLCFRLLANMSAGHVLLTLICKMTYGLWLLGGLFGILELMVCLVQAFVFLMLTSVYLDEALSH